MMTIESLIGSLKRGAALDDRDSTGRTYAVRIVETLKQMEKEIEALKKKVQALEKRK